MTIGWQFSEKLAKNMQRKKFNVTFTLALSSPAWDKDSESSDPCLVIDRDARVWYVVKWR